MNKRAYDMITQKQKTKQKQTNSSSAYWTSDLIIKTVTLDIKKMVDKRELSHLSETWTSMYIFCVSTIAFAWGSKLAWMECKLYIKSLLGFGSTFDLLCCLMFRKYCKYEFSSQDLPLLTSFVFMFITMLYRIRARGFQKSYTDRQSQSNIWA